MTDGQLDIGNTDVHRGEPLAEVGLSADGAERARARAGHRHRLLRKTLDAIGRDAQSRAFFNAPGMDELYSGVANTTASASRPSSRNASTVNLLLLLGNLDYATNITLKHLCAQVYS
jgi:hypothetical protein